MTENTDQKVCVGCGQRLSAGSKLTRQNVSAQEAKEHGWEGTSNEDGTITVHMCMQCQITRSNRAKHGY
ncbi:MAG: hypothetical protein WAM39_13185 [Bryobacteraceae bacterium]